jgi:pyroglutamyl-peptidase
MVPNPNSNPDPACRADSQTRPQVTEPLTMRTLPPQVVIVEDVMAMNVVVTGARPRQIVLVTGFGAFPGAPSNPTERLLEALETERPRLGRLGIDVHCILLPVVFAEIEAAMRDAVLTIRPDVILHFGLASRRRRISVETRAVNRAGTLHADASGTTPDRVVVVGGPPSLMASYPAARIVAALRRERLEAALSIDAGDYVCNATLYRSLLAPLAPTVGFIHVPKVRRALQPCARRRHRRPTLDDLTRAVVTTILVVAGTPA